MEIRLTINYFSGNLDEVKLEIGSYRFAYGQLLLGNDRGNFTPILANQSGISIFGAVDWELIRIGGKACGSCEE